MRLDAPISPRAEFEQALLEKLERALTGSELSNEELTAERGEELPLREAMSVISTDLLGAVDPSVAVGEVDAHQGHPGPEPGGGVGAGAEPDEPNGPA